MGRKKESPALGPKADPPKVDAKKTEEANAGPEEEAQAEHPPIVKDLEKLDDEYLAIEREYEKELQALQRKFAEKQRPLLDERAKVLAGDGSAEAASGTPAVSGFWLEAFRHHNMVGERIEDHDAPVLEYLKDVTKDLLDGDETGRGFKLSFHFAENPYFTNDVLTKEYHVEEDSPYTGEENVKQIKATEIEWKAGKDVTVDKVKKKAKGGGAKKGKQKKEKDAARPSFFRTFFRTLEEGMPMPDDAELFFDDPDEFEEVQEDESQIVDYIMEFDHDIGLAIKDQIVPFAVRWFTGEAAPDDDDDDEEGEEEDSEDDDEEDDDSEEESPKPSRRKDKGGGHKKEKGKASPETKPSGDKEECKQQ